MELTADVTILTLGIGGAVLWAFNVPATFDEIKFNPKVVTLTLGIAGVVAALIGLFTK